MEKKEFKKEAPAYKGNGASVWKRTASNGKEFLAIKVAGMQTICVFPIVLKPE